jgi:exopolyphosphatase/pppGpp-phosphohydrolase
MSAGVDAGTGANVDTAAATISIYKTSLDRVTLDRARRLLEGLGYLPAILEAYQLPEYELEDLSVRYLLMYASLGPAMARNVYLSGGMRADTLIRYGRLTPEFAQAVMLLAKRQQFARYVAALPWGTQFVTILHQACATQQRRLDPVVHAVRGRLVARGKVAEVRC